MTIQINQAKSIPIDMQRSYTAEELEWLEDDGCRYELLEGKLVVLPPTISEHGLISDSLLYELVNFLRANPGIGQVWSHTGFNIGKKPNGKDSVLEPDLGFLVASRVPATELIYLPYPDLAIEVRSRSSDLKDRSKLNKARKKLLLYLENGTLMAWVINPITRTVEVYRQGQEKAVRVLNSNDYLDGEEIIPGFRFKVEHLFSM